MNSQLNRQITKETNSKEKDKVIKALEIQFIILAQTFCRKF